MRKKMTQKTSLVINENDQQHNKLKRKSKYFVWNLCMQKKLFITLPQN